MKLLLVATNYPHAGHPSSGAFNERSARALQALGHRVEVLAPRPYAPNAVAACHPRWRAYRRIAEQETRFGLPIYRPAYLQLPGIGGVLRPDWCAYLSCVKRVLERHRVAPYDAVLAFNLNGAGGLAWRLARRLGIAGAGWATGSDVRVPPCSANGRAVRDALARLDLVFYQSSELLDEAASLSGLPRQSLSAPRHRVLARGVEAPPRLTASARHSLRRELAVRPDDLMVLFVGRIVAAKGVFELIEAVDLLRRKRSRVVCVLVGAHDGFDDSARLRKRLRLAPELADCVRLVPACAPEAVWQYLNAADIFAFPSHREGMPNSLLEAMAMGLPAVAYAIPPVLEIDGNLGVLALVPPRDMEAFARALAELADSPERRCRLGASARTRVLSRYLIQASMAEAVRRLETFAARRSGLRPMAPAFLPPAHGGVHGVIHGEEK